MPSIEAVGTAVPKTVLTQADLKRLASDYVGDAYRADRLVGIFDNAGVDERALAMPVEWYYLEHGHKERNAEFARVGLELAESAAREALERAGRLPTDIDGIVLVSSTGIAAPSLDAHLANRIGMRADIMRVPVWGLGCAAGVGGLNVGCDLVRARPDRRILVIALELCSLVLDVGRVFTALEDGARDVDRKTLIAASLFADGCAAVVLGEGDGPEVVAGASHLFPDTQHIMGWEIEDRNLEVVLSVDLPALVRKELGKVVRPFLDRTLGAGRSPEHWILHPGGGRVLDALRRGLGLTDEDMHWSEDVLRDHGNMSSPTVLFELRSALDSGRPAPGEHALLAALGPGFSSDVALVRG